MCVYGMEGPGGYQFVGRTVQVYNRFRTTRSFRDDTPWLLRFFDRIRFYPVSAAELLEMREAFPQGRFDVEITDGTFRLSEYEAMLRDNSESISAFNAMKAQAFAEERERWVQAGQLQFSSEEADLADRSVSSTADLPEGAFVVDSHVSGSIWKICVEAGQVVEAGATLVVVESMKMEVSVTAPRRVTVVEVTCRAGKPVDAGQALVVVREALS